MYLSLKVIQFKIDYDSIIAAARKADVVNKKPQAGFSFENAIHNFFETQAKAFTQAVCFFKDENDLTTKAHHPELGAEATRCSSYVDYISDHLLDEILLMPREPREGIEGFAKQYLPEVASIWELLKHDMGEARVEKLQQIFQINVRPEAAGPNEVYPTAPQYLGFPS